LEIIPETTFSWLSSDKEEIFGHRHSVVGEWILMHGPCHCFPGILEAWKPRNKYD